MLTRGGRGKRGTGAILKYAGNNLKGKFRMDKYDYYKAVEDDFAEFI